MSDNDPRSPQNKRPPGGDPQFNWRGLVFFAVTVALLAGAFLFRGGSLMQSETLSYPVFKQYVAEGRILATTAQPLKFTVEQGSKTEFLSGFYSRTTRPAAKPVGLNEPPAPAPSPAAETVSPRTSTAEVGGGAAPVATPSTSPVGSLLSRQPASDTAPFKVEVFAALNGQEVKKLLDDAKLPYTIVEETNLLATTLVSLLPILLFLLILYFLFRSQIKMAGKGAMNFGKSKARMLSRDKNKITFKDVAGVEEAKDEVQELVEFLKDPKKFQKLGGRIPKGVLMVGPPGTGKTLLARAIAGEADVPFFSISGSDFVEMFVGVGASRVRDMFEQGRKSAPCLIFIDEIDAVGRHRGHGLGGGHDEREQTLNQLLVEMDGFDAQDGVIIIAATNRPDVLDPALLRPGRFDRQVTVNLPDVKGREEILRVHAKKVKMAEDVDLGVIARGTPGFSGAELANVINEAALSSARKGLKAITTAELDEARDKVRWGRERRSLAMSEQEKIATAWHEAGHALLNVVLPHTHPLHKVTIIPRGPALGATMYLPEGDKYSTQRKEALALLAVTMGGRIAEEMFTNDVSNGASGDIMQATKLSRRMVCEWGMSSIGMIRFSEESEPVFLGRDMGRAREYSESTAQQIDAEVKKLIDDAYAHAKQVLEQYRDKVELIAHALLEFETLEGSQVKDLIELGHMRRPPVPAPKPPPLPPTPLSNDLPDPIKPGRTDLPPGGLPAPSPA